MECGPALGLMTDYLEGALRPIMRRRFARHLAACPACATDLAETRAMVAALGRLGPGAVPPDVVDELVGLYRRLQAG